MNECPVCKTTYTDDTLRFCLVDGASLILKEHETILRKSGADKAVVLSEGGGSATPWLKILLAVMAIGVVVLIIIGAVGAKFYFDSGQQSTATNAVKSSNSISPSPTESKITSSDDSAPTDPELQELIKDTASDFADAIDTGDFSKLHSKASSDFQSGYSVQQTKDAFHELVDNKALVLPSMKNARSVDATFSPVPSIRNEKGANILMLKGEFPSKPYPVKFDNEYVWRDGGWKMLKLKINM